VSVVLATGDRPRLLSIALECYRRQTYPDRELVVVDDGDRAPVDAAAVRAVGGRLLRVPPDTPLGSKLNLGVEATSGPLCQKWDDDGWYAPEFLDTMVSALLESWRIVCRPTIAYIAPFLFFDLARWEVRRAAEAHASGGTLLFQRENWQDRPFRPIPDDEDAWFLRDQYAMCVSGLAVRGADLYLAVRQNGGGTERGRTWYEHDDGSTIDDPVRAHDLYGLGLPEAIVPDWGLRSYRELCRTLPAGRP
jgi:glycosyltransferase involved in cell wall biosynthesis